MGWNDDGPASMVSIWPPVICASNAPCAVVAGGGTIRFAAAFGGGEASGQQADGRGLNIAFATGDLAGKTPLRLRLEAQRVVEEFRRIQERIAMQSAETGEFGVLQTRNGSENAAPARHASAWFESRPC